MSLRPRVLLLAVCWLALPGLLQISHAQGIQPQASGTVASGTVVDSNGAAIRGARILAADGALLATSDEQGRFTLPQIAAGAPAQPIQIVAPGFAIATARAVPGMQIVLQPESQSERVEVTAYRSPLATEMSPASTRLVNREQLDQAASPALDEKLRQVPGLELFRRSSSLISNPTSQGISLRGLGSTAASRTLVVEDDVPLNDPFGGWIHWDEEPELSIRSVEVERGGASDLYGSSAIGGVVNVLPVAPAHNAVQLLSSYGARNTLDDALLASATRGPYAGLASGGLLRTDGYTLVAPPFRGPVDIPSNVHAWNGLAEGQRSFAGAGRVFLRGSGLNEVRSNGTPLQTNGTRLWRYATGLDWSNDAGGALAVRAFGSTEHFRQTFSSIATGRKSESLTRSAQTPADELGASAYWTQAIGTALVVLAGADTHDVRASDNEIAYSGGRATAATDTTARQRQTGVYGEALWTPANWTLSAAGRVDHFTNFAATAFSNTNPGGTAKPTLNETVFDPRLGIARRILPGLSLTASAFRAYRAPTVNELYRQGQVGQQITLANASLKSERATGWEAGVAAAPGRNSTVRASYFWTQVNRPITALTLSTTPTQILLRRENLGQIESRGVAVDFSTQPAPWLNLLGGYQYARATVTRFDQQPQLVGKWIPQVARNMATAQVRLSSRRAGVLSVQGRLSGRQFDDDANRFLLHGYFRLDAYASHDLGRRLEVFASVENLCDRAIQVGRTPILTVGTPQEGRIGLRLRLGE